ncbi:hypothetical protein CJO79_15495 [Ralstonia solanacearum]|nr:hypothetical protein CJO79_15495 [Ralstonia solanacearum]AXW20356.1 hypothetical protein CJO85_15545 [Ralstonia solanacearum]AXW77176.1 hypothetical protein CJO97_15490 [Ralstonia solanacearum]
MLDQMQGMRFRIVSTPIPKRVWIRIWQLLIILTAVCAFVPLRPEMPQAGLDHSWVLGMNQAVAQGLVFGRDIIFTFGPYASIYTKSFHPTTDHLMVVGALFLGLIYGTGLVLVARGREAIPLAGLCLALALAAGLQQSQDSLLLAYPLIVSLYCFGLPRQASPSQGAWSLLAISVSVLFLPFGLLPLIKGSLVALCLAVTLFAVIRFVTISRWDLAIAAPLSQALALITFWLASGQPLSGLPGYFQSMTQIVSGYTEAMAYTGSPSEIILYLIAAAALVVSVLRDSSGSKIKNILALSLPLLAYFFVVFKAAFVRHDGHALTAGTSILLASAILFFLLNKRSVLFVLLLSIVSWASIDSRYITFSASTLLDSIASTYYHAWNGLGTRLAASDTLNQSFDTALAKIHSQIRLPQRDGTTDIYSYGQSYLIASGNRWNPRPVLQSYSAYTPALARINRDHLLGRTAPDNIFFKVESIDGRLPALDDGPSWPALLTRYRPDNLENNFLYLRKASPEIEPILPRTEEAGAFSLGEQVAIPDDGNPVFVEAGIEKNLAGKVLNTLYKVDPLVIALNLANGETRLFRLPSEMAQSGFIVSPLLESTLDFALLYANTEYLRGNKVKSFSIHATGGDWLWKKKFTVRFGKVVVPPHPGTLASLHLAKPANVPAGTDIRIAERCEGSIDGINGLSPAPAQFGARGLLRVNGWLAIQTEKERLPKKALLVLASAEGKLTFIETRRVVRPDVGAHFGSALLQLAGYTAIADVSQVAGDRTLGLAFEQDGRIEICPQFRVAGQFSGQE